MTEIKIKLCKSGGTFWHTQCPNLLTRLYSLTQVNYISGLMYGIVNECIGAIPDTAYHCVK